MALYKAHSVMIMILVMIILAGIMPVLGFQWNKQIVYDDFSGTTLNTSLWTTSGGAGLIDVGVTRSGWMTSKSTGADNYSQLRAISLKYEWIKNITIQANLTSGVSGSADLIMLGLLYTVDSSRTNESVWTLIRNESAASQFLVYVDGVYKQVFTPNHAQGYDVGTSVNYGAGSFVQFNYVYVTFIPTVNVTYLAGTPTDGQIINSLGTIAVANFNATTTSNTTALTNMSLFLDGAINQTTSISNLANSTKYTVTFGNYSASEIHTFYVQSCDADGNCLNGENRTFYIMPLAFNSFTYNATTYETSQESFSTNISFDSSTFSLGNVYLNYNGTNYLASNSISGNTSISTVTNVTIPVVTTTGTNLPFYWTVNLAGSPTSYSFNSSTYNQTVNKGTSLKAGTCPAGYVAAINFTFNYESNRSSADVSSLTINYLIAYGLLGNNTASYIYNSTGNLSVFSICINATQESYYIGNGEISYTIPGTAARRYYLFSGTRITNETIVIPLYSLETASSTSFLFTAQDTALRPYAGYYVSLLRWYPEINSYQTVEMGKTDDKGQTVLHIKTEDVDYRIGLYTSTGVLIKLFSPVRFVCQTQPCTYSLFVDSNPIDLASFTNIQSSLTWDATTKKFTYTWNDPSQVSQIMNLTVWKDSGTANTIICSSSSTGYTGVLICDVSAYTGTLRAEVTRTSSPPVKMAQLIESVKQTIIDVGGGSVGLLIGAILLIFFALIGAVSPVMVVIFAVISMIPLMIMGNITWGAMAAIGVIGGLVIHFSKRVG